MQKEKNGRQDKDVGCSHTLCKLEEAWVLHNSSANIKKSIKLHWLVYGLPVSPCDSNFH